MTVVSMKHADNMKPLVYFTMFPSGSNNYKTRQKIKETIILFKSFNENGTA